MNNKGKPVELKIQLDDKTAEGTYVNFLSVFHNQAEFVMDFGRMVPGKPEVKIMARLLSNPIALKQITMTLKENLDRYEANYGEIPVKSMPPSPKEFIQ